MKQTARIISTYSADAFGVCSALFELGGMTVMHDASGCNSTYTTHDEPRWFDMDSMVFISGLSEIEAIMGDDAKLIDDIVEAADSLHPRFIALCGTPIPMMTGFDYEAVAEIIETETGIPTFGFPTSGMNTYVDGASMALAGIAERFVDEPDEGRKESGHGSESESRVEGCAASDRPIRVNILGLTPLDFSTNGTDRSLAAWLEQNGFEVVSRWAMGCTLEELSRAGEADVDLVVSAVGCGAAEVLKRRFGIPYVSGLPIGKWQSMQLIDKLKAAAARNTGIELVTEGRAQAEGITNAPLVAVIGEGVTSLAAAKAIELEKGLRTRVLCATECPAELLRDCDRMTPDEDDIIPELADAAVIVADPLYRPICPAAARFIALPAESFSGRIYRSEIPDLIADPDWLLGQL